ncbi:hypothetical protein R1sor_015105 [Riccia sorocarpa]|uniref:Rad21/Rec8-like protein N-terminal domain-containing protein n=1 Tax=Riccia sorocarpa TaxID=122646 RepID=A0ABD3HFJ5_9MARC
MFFSNQLLCRKGPLGQIWVVATMHAKLNRKKAEQINIEEICLQVLQPQVPLALRLSGILMGGIVLIYDRKVKLLYDDVNEFLVKLKSAVDHKDHDKRISLPKGRLQARFESVTIDYDFDDFDDIERALYAPVLSGQEEGNMDQQENPVSGRPDPYQQLSSSRESKRVSSGNGSSGGPVPLLHQVNSEDITLEERDPSGSFHERYEDTGMDFQEDRIPPSDNLFMDDFFPEFRAAVSASPEPVPTMPSPLVDIQMETEVKTEEPSEQHFNADEPELEMGIPSEDGNLPEFQSELEPVVPPQEADQPPEHEPDNAPAPAPANLKRRRVRSRTARRIILDEVHVEIPAPVFATWIRDTSDIRERQRNMKAPVGKDPAAARVQRQLDLPSVALLSPACVRGLEPFWAPQLSGLWDRTLTGKLPPPPQEVPDFRAPWPTGPQARGEQVYRPSTPLHLSARNSAPDSQNFGNTSGGSSSPANEQAGDFNSEFLEADIDLEADRRVNEQAGDFNPEFPEADIDLEADIDPQPAEDIQALNDFRDYGSVERLRAALNTPSAASDDLLSTVFGRTPGPQVRYTRSDRSRSTAGSGGSHKTLPLDPEAELPSDGSGRFKKPRRLGSFRSNSHSPVTFDKVSPGVDGAGSSYNFFTSQAASLNRMGKE